MAGHPDWHLVQEYVDTASANDLRNRTARRDLLDDAARQHFDAALVFKLDRTLRSVKHMHETLAVGETRSGGLMPLAPTREVMSNDIRPLG